jgi:ABC-type antimicrobial peptide transport system permease subunit
VAQRRQEIGIRVALGARLGDVSWMVVRQALGLAAIGIATGGVLSIAAVAVAANLIPARRALRVEAMEALRTGS